MTARILKVIFKIAFSILGLLFINNPLGPLSIPLINDGVVRFTPIFNPEYVLHYQIIFSLFVLAGLLLAILEFIANGIRKVCELIEDSLSIAQLYIMREIPREAVTLPEHILDKVYPAAYWFFSFIMMLAAVGVIIKVFQLLANQRKPIEPK